MEGNDMWDSVGFGDVELVNVTRERFEQFWGVNMKRFAPVDLPAGSIYYKLVKLSWRDGWCGCAVKVIDEDGKPIQGEQIFQGWDNPEKPLPGDVPPPGGLPSGYPNTGTGGFTNADGVIGFGWGTGEWFDPTVTEGPHWYWRGGENGDYSDVSCGHGWWDEHDVLEPTFQRIIVGEPPEPEPEPEGDELARIADALEELVAWLKRP